MNAPSVAVDDLSAAIGNDVEKDIKSTCPL